MPLLRARQVAPAVVALVTLFLPSANGQDAARGAALMAEARKAVGGEEKLAAITRLQVTGTFLRSTGPDQIIDGDFDVLLEPPDKYRRNELTGFAGANVDRTEVLNGTSVWDETASAAGRGFGGGGFGRDRGGRGGFGGGGGGRGQRDAGPAVVDDRLKEQLRRVRQAELARLTLVWLLMTDGPVAWIGTAESPDGTADVVEVKPPNGVATRLFLEPKTHMPLMISWQGQPSRGGDLNRRGGGGRNPAPRGQRGGVPETGGAPGQQATLELHMSDYKTVGGVKLPHLITRGTEGTTQEELKIKSFKINPAFKADTFIQ